MKAAVFHKPGDIQVDTVDDPITEDSRDVILKVTSTAICGSDLHILSGAVPQAEISLWGTSSWALWKKWDRISHISRKGTGWSVRQLPGFPDVRQRAHYPAGPGACINYIDKLIKLVSTGKVVLDDIISHSLPLSEAAHAYRIFDKKEDDFVKVVLKP